MPMGEIDRAMKEGDAEMLVPYFGSSIDIAIGGAQSTYSPAQAEMVLRKFFLKNGVRNFELLGANDTPSDNGLFRVGTLATTKGSFRVYLYLKAKDNKVVLRQIRIDNEPSKNR